MDDYHVRADLGAVAKDELALFVLVEILARQLLGRTVVVQHVHTGPIQQAIAVSTAVAKSTKGQLKSSRHLSSVKKTNSRYSVMKWRLQLDQAQGKVL